MTLRATILPCVAAVTMLSVLPVSAQPPAETPFKKVTNSEPVPRRGFNVVLLLGDMQDGWGQETVPVAARKALADMKDFLPYKVYRLIDTQWVLASNSGPAIVRLRGWEDQEYELELRASPAFAPNAGVVNFSPTASSVRFVLRDANDGAGVTSGEGGRTTLQSKESGKAEALSLEIGREIYQLERERDDLQPRISKGRKDVDVGMASPDEIKRLEVQLAAVTRRLSDLKQSLSAASSKVSGRPVIDTSFRMEDGETVVVGTSKVKGGGKALIALLTATAERPKGATK
jgi:hypothetical protein